MPKTSANSSLKNGPITPFGKVAWTSLTFLRTWYQMSGRSRLGHEDRRLIAGKRLGAPVAQLLGGFYRSEVPLSISIANPDFDEDLAFAKERAREGVNIFKVKTGFASHAEDLRRLERLRGELPASVDLRVDYNQGLDPWNAIGLIKDVEAFRPTFVEQPVKRDQRAAMAAITRAIDTPIMADES